MRMVETLTASEGGDVVDDRRQLGEGLARRGTMAAVNERAIRKRVVQICSKLPEVEVLERHPPHLGFVVGKKNFAWYTVNEHDSGRVVLIVRAEGRENEELVASDPERFELPKYVARHGYVGYFLDLAHRPPDWEEVDELVRDSYRLQAPKRLVRLLDG
jgi:hypothetical protein